VVFWDRESGASHVLFSNFAELLKGATRYLKMFSELNAAGELRASGLGFVRSRCVAEIIKSDPSGAGGPGIAYWEPWINA